MTIAFGELVAEQQGMMVARGAGQASQEQPLPHGHALKIHRVVVLDDRIDPVNVLKTETRIVIGCLPKIDHCAADQGLRQAKNSRQQQECYGAELQPAVALS